MNQKFLDKIADHLNNQHQGDFTDVIVVVPSGRARRYLLKYLEAKIKKIFWTPEFFTLPEFVSKLHGGKMGGELEMTLAMYGLWRFEGKMTDTFSEFIKWSSIAIKDFNEIDASLAEANRVFADLRSIREIEDWSMNNEKLSAAQIQYADFWIELGKLYQSYADWQKSNDTFTYQRMARMLCEAEKNDFRILRNKTLYVIGISGFSLAEKNLLDKISEDVKTEIIWDVDAYYTNDGMHEAGENFRKSGIKMSAEWMGSSFSNVEKNIEIYECGTSVTQVMKASGILGDMNSELLNDTCVVIADENMFEPFVTSLSEMSAPVNLSIGVPLKQNAVFRILDAILKIRSASVRLNKGIYHTEFVKILQLMKQLGILEEVDSIQKKLIHDVRIYLDDEYLRTIHTNNEWGDRVLRLLDGEMTNKEWVAESIAIVQQIQQLDELTQVGAQKLLNTLYEIETLLASYDFLQESESLHLLFNKIAGALTVHYEGMPGVGLEVMNMVETRALDFNTVLVLGANEDVLPGNLFDQSYIPIDLRAYYKLPLPIVKESTYAYTFYRLLQRASSVYLFYSSISSDFKGTEQSRYITQLENELTAVNPNVKITRKNVRTMQYRASTQTALNDDFAKERLDKLFEYGISPSAINKYVACPLDFYYRYIVGLGEEEQVEETMSSATFGSVVHYVLEKFYEKFIGSFPDENDLNQLQLSLIEKIDEALLNLYSVQNTSSGENYLQKRLAVRMLEKYIEHQRLVLKERSMTGITTTLKEIEAVMSRAVDSASYSWNKPVVIRGKIDRVDLVDDEVHIIDYKTGRIESKDVQLAGELKDLFTKTEYSKKLQLMIYIYMYQKHFDDVESIRAGLFSMVDFQAGYQFLSLKDRKLNTDLLQDFELSLMNWVRSVYECQEFAHNPQSKFCEYCY